MTDLIAFVIAISPSIIGLLVVLGIRRLFGGKRVTISVAVPHAVLPGGGRCGG